MKTILVQDLLDLIDFPEDCVVELYDYFLYDTVFMGICDEVPEEYKQRKVKGIETSQNRLVINMEDN